ncbi:Uncharacterised protein [Klebsiella pneumoniae]|nr:Uncharacterised protein [Klebsiella pneumoniae]
MATGRRCRSPVRKWPGISALIRWGWGMCSPPSHGLMSSARSRAAGCSTASARSASISGRSSSGRCLPCCRASSISSAALALSLRCLPCASSSALPSRRHSPATAGSSPPGSRRRRGGQRYRFLTPPSTLPPLFSRRSWAG